MIEIGDKKFRNLQEQVAYNAEQIEELLDRVKTLKRIHNVSTYAFNSGSFQIVNFTLEADKETPFESLAEIAAAIADKYLPAIGHGIFESVSQVYYAIYVDDGTVTLDYADLDGNEGQMILTVDTIIDNVI